MGPPTRGPAGGGAADKPQGPPYWVGGGIRGHCDPVSHRPMEVGAISPNGFGGGGGGCGGGVEEEVAHQHTKVRNIHSCLLSYIITYYKRI